jgi:hypothetical protein
MQLMLRLQSLVAFVMNVYSAFFFLFYAQKSAFDATLIYTLLIWNLLSMVTQSPKTMMWATIVLIYPFYFVDHVLSLYKEINKGVFTRSAVLLPLDTWRYFYVVFLGSIHLGICILSSKDNHESELYRLVERMEKKNQVNNDKYMTLIFRIYDLFRLRLDKVYRYIPIMIAIFTALQSISILNGFLLLFALFFMWNRRNDTVYWFWFNGYIMFMLLIKQLSNYNMDLNNYNIEFLAILGIISVEEDQKGVTGSSDRSLRWLMIWNFILVWFSSQWYKKLNKKITQQSLIQQQEDEIKINKISQLSFVKLFLRFYNVCAMIFQYYSIWIYHMGANIILLTDTRDLLNISLLVVESMIALIHIIIWNRRGAHPYKKVYRVWIISFYLIVVYVLCRYLIYFQKYTTISSLLSNWTGGDKSFDMNRHILRSIDSISREDRHNSLAFLSSFIRPILLLVLAVLTRETFLRMFRGDASYNPGLLRNTKNDMGQNEYEKKAFEGEQAIFAKDIETIERRTNPFVVIYLLFKGLFLGVVMSYLHYNMNVLKITMIFCYLANMHVLFQKLISLCSRMKIVELFTLRAQYFYHTFLTGKKWKKYGNEGKITSVYTAEEQKTDLLQNKIYYEQILVSMEQILFYVNRLFWGMVFFPLLFLSTTLMLLNYIVRNQQLATDYHMELFLGISSTKWLKEEEVTKELLGIQIVISGLFFEYMLTSCYLDCKAVLVEANQTTLDELLKNLEIKFRYFVDTRLEHIPRDKANDRLEEFKAAISYVPIVKAEVEQPFTERNTKTSDLDNTLKDELEVKDASIESDELKSEDDKKKDDSDDEDLDDDEDERAETDDPHSKKEDLEGAELLRSVILDHAKKQGTKSSVFYMTEMVTKEEMLLFLNKNKYKYYYIKCLESALYIMSRLAIIPLIYPLASSINVVNIGFLLMFLSHNVTPKRTFLEDTRQKGLIVFFYFAIQSLHSFIHDQALGYEGYKNFFKEDNLATHFYLRYLMPIDGKLYSVCFYWLFIVCLGFSTIPIFVWTTTKYLFREKVTLKDHFHFYLYDQNRRRNIVIDYKQWRKSPLSVLNNIYKSVYTNALASHTFILILTLIALWKDWFIMVFLFTLAISIYEHFKSDSGGDSDTIMGMSRKTYLVLITKIYLYMYWVLLGVYHVMDLLGMIETFKDYTKDKALFMSNYNFGVIVPVLMVITGLYQDLVMSEDYLENAERLGSETTLKIRYANICRAYDINESKIYCRIVEIMRKNYIDRISNQILDSPEIARIKFDPTYSDKSILDYLSNSGCEIKARFLGAGKRFWLKCLDSLYSFIIYQSNNYRYMDMMFLYQIVQMRNRNVLNVSKRYQELAGLEQDDTRAKEEDAYKSAKERFELENEEEGKLNLEDYFDHNFHVFKKTFTDINIFYCGLQESESEKYDFYNLKIKQFLSKNFGFKEPDIYHPIQRKLTTTLHPTLDLNIGLNVEVPLVTPFELPEKRRAKIEQEAPTKEELEFRRGLLSDAAEILARRIQHRLNEDTQYILESYKLEFSRCGSIECKFGKMMVVMFNTKQDYLMETRGFNILSMKVVAQYLSRVIMSNSEWIVSISLILIHVFYGGFTNILLVGIILFTIFLEETTGRSFWWRILYVCYLIMTFTKQVYDSSKFLRENEKIMIWALGKLGKDAMIPDTICILLVMYMIEFLKKYEVDGKSAIDFENPGQAICRLTVNEDIQNMLDRVVNEDVRKKQLLNEYLSSKMPINQDIIGRREFKMLLIRYLIGSYGRLQEFSKEFLYCAQKFLRAVRYDMTKVQASDLNSFLFRNFSHYLRKSGKDYNGVASVVLILLIIYVLTFFPTMGSEKTQYASFIIENKVTAFTVINFAIYLSFFVGHYYLDQMKTSDIKGLKSKEYTLSLIGEYDAQGRSTMQDTRFGRFQSAASLVKNAMILGNSFNKKFESTSDYVKNPLMYLFMFCMFLWVYANASVFLWHPVNNNFRSHGKVGMYRFICEDRDKAGDLKELGKLPCQNYSENYLSKIFYLLNVMYIIICMLQIKGGKIFPVSKVTDFTRLGNLIQYKAYENLPLVRETRMTFEYCATQTSLWFSDFTLLKELEYVLHDAKMLHSGEMKNKTGKQLSRLVQNIICFIVIFIVVLLFVVPLYLFYNRDNKNFFPINSASIEISLLSNYDQPVINLFTVTKLKTNFNVNPEKGTELIKKHPSLRMYSTSQFMVTFR